MVRLVHPTEDKPAGAAAWAADNRETGVMPVRTRHCIRLGLRICHWETGKARGRDHREPGDLPAGVQGFRILCRSDPEARTTSNWLYGQNEM